MKAMSGPDAGGSVTHHARVGVGAGGGRDTRGGEGGRAGGRAGGRGDEQAVVVGP